MKEKEEGKLIEIFESKKMRKALYSRCKVSQIWTPNYNLFLQTPPCQC